MTNFKSLCLKNHLKPRFSQDNIAMGVAHYIQQKTRIWQLSAAFSNKRLLSRFFTVNDFNEAPVGKLSRCSSLERDENCYEHLGQHSATEDESSAASNDHIHQTIIMTQFPAEDLVVIPQGTQLHRRHQNCLVTMPVIMVSIL